MKDLAIYGAGGFGRETALLIHQMNALENQWNFIGYYDDGLKKGSRIDGSPVLGSLEDLKLPRENASIVVAIADPVNRQSIVSKLAGLPIEFPSLFHPACQRGSESNQFGKGCILTAGVILTTNIALHDFVIVNLLTTIGHDVVAGSFTTIMPGCSISGNVKIGECSLIGSGVRILQNLTIGEHCKVGAGAVVTHDFQDHKTIIGVPAYEK